MNTAEHRSPSAVFVAIVFCAMAGGLFSCASGPRHWNQGDDESGKPLATVRRAGGLLFSDDRVDVYPDGSFTIHHLSGQHKGDSASGRLPPDVIRDFTSVLKAIPAGIDSYPNPPAIDSHEYQLIYNGRTITWNEFSQNIPPALAQIGDLFNSAFLPAFEQRRQTYGEY